MSRNYGSGGGLPVVCVVVLLPVDPVVVACAGGGAGTKNDRPPQPIVWPSGKDAVTVILYVTPLPAGPGVGVA